MAYGKASSLNPQAGSPLNGLGYAYLRQGKADEAIDAFKRYASAMPNEPNPQDSLAEALMAGGRDGSGGGVPQGRRISQDSGAWEGVLPRDSLPMTGPAAAGDRQSTCCAPRPAVSGVR